MTDQLPERSHELLTLLVDTFGDSEHVIFACDRHDAINAIGGNVAAKLAGTYLEWCVAYPQRIGNQERLYNCRNKCQNGWIPSVKHPDEYRPCSDCLSGAYDQWIDDFRGTCEEESDGML